MKLPTVQILLSCHNSQAFLGDLLGSLERQTFTDWQLLVRDDGSTDGTQGIVKGFEHRSPGRLEWLRDDGGAAGPCQSFGRLLRASTASYVMFCDHDDVWLPRKIERTLETMREAEVQATREGRPGEAATPILVFTDLAVVDVHLRPLGPSYWTYHHCDPRRTSLAQLLVQNVVTGCTVMLNRPLAELAQPIPPQAVMHDGWVALVAACFGTIRLLDEPTVLYRQHDGNVLGVKPWGLRRIVRRALSSRPARHDLACDIAQARALLEQYAERLPPEKKATLAAFASLPDRTFLGKRLTLLRHRLFKSGLLRTLGLLRDV